MPLIDWNKIHEELEGERLALQEVKEQAEKYINSLKSQFTGQDIGLVHTKFEEDIKEHSKFLMFIQSGMHCKWKYITLQEARITFNYDMPYLNSLNN
jgi:hypothetical protein